jgi:pimeloyl-ACP methyl ester carboxylesterase
MTLDENSGTEAARTAAPDSIGELISSTSEDVLRALLENPSLDETHVCMLLERKELSGALLEEIAKRRRWRATYRVRRALAGHPHTPRRIAMRILRDLHLMDLVRISLMPASPGELRGLAEEQILAQLIQLPLGQRLMLARRGSGRIAAALIAQGPEQVARIALDNPFLTESQLLKTLAKEALKSQIIAIIGKHEKWPKLANVRAALLRHPHSPIETVLAYLPELPRREIEDLLGLARLPAGVRVHLRDEFRRREKQ